ncbi:MAG: rod shape-determining protein RodA [Anaerolineae bacterium]|nr:rod shape-determining protein RodA [Anaerolineae bacterium]
MTRRSWRNFDYLLLVALFILSAYGVIMIYSATINTLGLGDPVQRQIIYVVAGIGLLLVTASIDYRLLEFLQHPMRLLPPLLLALVSVGLTITGRLQSVEGGVPPTLETFRADIPVMAFGILLVLAVFALDRLWIEKLDLALTRGLLSMGFILAAGVAYVLVSRSTALSTPELEPLLMAIGLAAVYLLDCLTLRFADTLRNPLYVLVLGLLGIVFLIGQISGGSQRWLAAGAVQPSELSKVLMIIVLAKFLADREDDDSHLKTIVTSLGIIGLPMLLIYLQPDLGTALALGAIWLSMIWLAGIRSRYLVLLGAGGIAALPIIWLNLEDYMRERLMLFVNPAGDPDSYFNVHQALVSIGSGGWTGKGLTHGTQSQLHFLRVRHTDFIFAVTAEELGFLGALLMIALLFFLLWRILRIAEHSRDRFGRLIAAGMAGLIFFQGIINIGMNLGLMPVTGIPLPFVSYGGSSFLTLMLGIGLVESVAMRHKKLEFD